MIYTRLVNGLEILGLNAGNYYLNLNETIFRLAGIKEDKEDFFEEYIEECRKVNGVDFFNQPELLNNMAFCLYNKLIEQYKAKKHKK